MSRRAFVRPRLAAWMLSCAVALAGGISMPAAAADPSTVPVGAALREAALQGLNGPARKLSSYRGRPLIINVWASWCGPCRQEMASLERLAWSDAGAQFTVIGISTDDDIEQARAFLGVANATINHYIDRKLEMEHMLGAEYLPLTVLVDAQGRVVEKVVGARAWDSPETVAMIRKAFGLRGKTR